MNTLQDILGTAWNASATDALFATGPPPQPVLDALPGDYLDTIGEFGGREGFLGTEYLRLHRIEELAALNVAYDVPSAVPEVFIFGSDGALEAFAFMLQDLAVVKIPFIPLRLENARIVAPSFTDFISHLHRTGPSLKADPARQGMQLHCKHPIALGGDPIAEDNRVLVPLQKHAEIARYWNKVYNQAISQSGDHE